MSHCPKCPTNRHYKSFDGVGAEAAALAAEACAAAPHFVELFDGGCDDGGVVGKDSGLEVASAVGLHAHSRTRKVGAANVACRLVDDDNFEVDTWAHRTFETGGKAGVAVEVGKEVRPGLFGVEQTNVHPAANHLRQNAE